MSQPTDKATTLVEHIIDLQDRAADIADQIKVAKTQLIDELGIVSKLDVAGAKVTISEPSRKFNLDKAWSMLTPEQQAVCTSPDAKKIKGQLPPAVADMLMEPGTGSPVVKVS